VCVDRCRKIEMEMMSTNYSTSTVTPESACQPTDNCVTLSVAASNKAKVCDGSVDDTMSLVAVSNTTSSAARSSATEKSTNTTTNSSPQSTSTIKKRKANKKSLSKSPSVKHSGNNKSNIAQIFQQKPQNQTRQTNLYSTSPMTAQPSSFLPIAPAAVSSTVTTASPAAMQNVNQTPRNFVESQVLLQLRQMGFGDDTASVLGAIRQICDISNASTTITLPIQSIVDQVSIALISKREALEDVLEDAAQIDAARILSEADAESEKKIRIHNRRQQLHNSSIQDILEHFRKKSILLSSDDLSEMIIKCCAGGDEKVKSCIIQLLELERNALFWYQQRSSVSVYKYCGVTSYFKFILMPKLQEEQQIDSFRKLLFQEAFQLQNCLFSLEEQDKCGVPKIFLQAGKDAEINGWCSNEVNINNEQSDDDEIEIIQ
jgi:hypothetical protein